MELTAAVLQALHFASTRHHDQRWKGTALPYHHHLIGVLDLLSRVGGISDATTLVAAALHDVVEDTKTTREELATHFGQAVASIVEELTDAPDLSESARRSAQVAKAGSMSPAAQVIKLADKLANIRDVLHYSPQWTAEERRAYIGWGAAVVDALRGINPPLEAAFDQLLADQLK